MDMFDPFKQAKLQNSYSTLRDTKIPVRDMSLDDLKKLSGVNHTPQQSTGNQLTNSQKHQLMREHNIKPGDQAWFKLWFAKPNITGESPI